MKLKKLAALALCLGVSAGAAFADVPFRQHRYESFKATPADNVDVMFVGNSITHMHEWWEAFGSVQTVSGRGNSGGIVPEILENLESFIDGKPKKLFLMIGTNDIGRAGTEATADLTARRIRAIIKRIQVESPETEIYIESILPRTGMNGSIARANAQIKSYCEELGVNYIDLTQTMAELPNSSAWSLDGLHPQVKGYSAWTHYIEPQVGYESVYPAAADITEFQTAGTSGSNAMRIGQFSYLPVKQGDVLIFGDELVHGGEWHELLGSPKVKDRGTGWGVGGINLGQGKGVITAALEGQAEKPAAIIINYGEGGSEATNYRAIITEAKRLAPDAKICCMSLPPRAKEADDTNIKSMNATIKSAAEALGVTYIDIYTPLSANRGKFIMNGTYITGQGYAVIANEIADALNDPDLKPISLETAEALIARRNNRAIVGNMLTDAFMTDAAEGKQAALDAAVNEAVAALNNDITQEQAREIAAKLETAVVEAKGYVVPQLSNDAETHWYIIRSVRRDRVAASSGGNLVGLTEVPSAESTLGNNVWKLMDRGDGTFDVVNMLGEYVSAQGIANNTGMKVTTTAPAGGWQFSKSDYNGYSYVIYSDATNNAQWNQSNNGTFPILNWHPATTYPILTDEGSSYYFVEYFGKLAEPELATGWFQITVNSGISGLGDANRMINADEEKRQNATNYYALMYGPEQTDCPAKEFIHITIDGITGPYHFTGLNGHGVKENCTSSREAISADNPAVSKVSDGVYTIGKWNIYENYVGKSSGSNNTFTIHRVSDDVLGQYDIWTVEIVAANHGEVGKDVRVTLDNAANKGISTVFNGGKYFLTKGAQISPDQLSFVVENEQALTEPHVSVDNVNKSILINFNETPDHTTGWYQITVNSGISGLDDANRMINADEEKRQNATNYYALMYGPEQTDFPAKEFIHITVDERTGVYHFTGLNGHGVKENCTSSREALPADNPAVNKVSDGVYSIGKWNIYENYVGKSSGSNNTFTIQRVADDVLGQYDIWTVEIVAENHGEVGKDVRVTLDNAANKGISTVFNGGKYFLTKGAEISPEQLSFAVENEQVLTEPYVKVDNAGKSISVNFKEGPVDSIAAIKADVDGTVYDLQGRRVVNPSKGLYIIGGKLIRR